MTYEAGHYKLWNSAECRKWKQMLGKHCILGSRRQALTNVNVALSPKLLTQVDTHCCVVTYLATRTALNLMAYMCFCRMRDLSSSRSNCQTCMESNYLMQIGCPAYSSAYPTNTQGYQLTTAGYASDQLNARARPQHQTSILYSTTKSKGQTIFVCVEPRYGVSTCGKAEFGAKCNDASTICELSFQT